MVRCHETPHDLPKESKKTDKKGKRPRATGNAKEEPKVENEQEVVEVDDM